MKKKDEKQIESEIRSSQKFSTALGLADQSAGIFKGTSIVPLTVQLKTEISQFIRANTKDSSGSLIKVLEKKINSNDALLATHSKNPLNALLNIITIILSNKSQLYEFVRQIDQEYGATYQEKPYFQQPGQSAHDDDEYTHDSVRLALKQLQESLVSKQVD